MTMLYRGFKLFSLLRDGGHFVRIRAVERWPLRIAESPFFETDVFASENDAILEAKRLVDDDPRRSE